MRHILLLLFVTLIGCSQSDISGLMPAEGTVYFDGKPVDGVSIVFTPSTGSRYATAVSKPDGGFALNTVGRPGALPGEYTVTMTKTKTVPPEGIVYEIPWIYGDASKSGMVIEVPPQGSRELRLDLKPDDTPPPKLELM